MSSPVPEISTLELKYCERCGGLCLRPRASRAVYCPACARRLRELPPADGVSVSRSIGPCDPGGCARPQEPPVAWLPAGERPIDGQGEEARCRP